MLISEENIELYQQKLLKWWKGNSRTFPWRENRAMYPTAVAELMLRRTRADQVVPVYTKFLSTYTSLAAAAAADPDTVKGILRPLGLAWRAENIVSFLKQAYVRFGEDIPKDVKELRTLPGVGDYVGAAIVCFSDNQRIALIDTNVVRVLGRIFGLNTSGEARRRREMRELATAAVHPNVPAEYHYALLDFGAKICTAAKPRCNLCPFSVESQCAFYQIKKAQALLENAD